MEVKAEETKEKGKSSKDGSPEADGGIIINLEKKTKDATKEGDDKEKKCLVSSEEKKDE